MTSRTSRFRNLIIVTYVGISKLNKIHKFVINNKASYKITNKCKKTKY